MDKTKTKGTYKEAVGRRKTAVARVRLSPGKGEFIVNDKEVGSYFVTKELQTIANGVFEKGDIPNVYSITVVVKGGGIHAQAEAVRHGISRLVVEEDETRKKPLKQLGFIKRDSRRKERKKFGLKKARKAPTWSKR